MNKLKVLFNSLILLALAVLLVMPAYAIDGTLIAPAGTRAPFGSPGVTSPAGMVFLPGSLGGHLWVSDHLKGFCRFDPTANGTVANDATCIQGVNAKKAGVPNVLGPVSPGQPVFDSVNKFVYVSDDAATVAADATTSGVWRLTFDPVSETITNTVLLVNMSTLGAGLNKPKGLALDAAGNLYVGGIVNSGIAKITNPNTLVLPLPLNLSNVNSTFGLTLGVARGVDGLAVANGPAGQALYLAELGGGVTRINITGPIVGGTADRFSPLVISPITVIPTAIASTADGSTLFIADTPPLGLVAGATSSVLRYTIATDTKITFATTGLFPGGTTTLFVGVSGLSIDPSGNLFIGDDPTAGVQVLQGHIWKIPAGSPPLTIATLFSAIGGPGITTPGGILFLNGSLGGHAWVSDHGLGFCRLDPSASAFAINQLTCVQGTRRGGAGPVSPGQPAFDNVTNFIYVPDDAATAAAFGATSGVWRLTFDPVTETINNTVLLVNMSTLGTGLDKPRAVALDAAGNLYVGGIVNGNIAKITGPDNLTLPPLPAANVTTTFGTVAGAITKGVDGLAVANGPAGQALYLAELGGGVTRINLPAGGTAVRFSPINISSTATIPTAITTDGVDTLFIANSPGLAVPPVSTILEYTIAGDIATTFSTQGILLDGTTTPYTGVSGLGLHPALARHVFIGDDPTAGAVLGQGHVYLTVPDILPPVVTANPTTPAAVRTGNMVTLNATVIDTSPDRMVSGISGVNVTNVTVNVSQINNTPGVIRLIRTVALDAKGGGIYTASVIVDNATDGINLLNVTASDNATAFNNIPPDNVNDTAQIVVTVDNTPPVFVNSVNATVEAAFNSSVIMASFTDATSGVKMVTVDLTPIGTTFAANINGSQVPTNSIATGNGTFVINTTNNILSFNIEFSGLAGPETAAHIHGPLLGNPDAILFTLPLGSPKNGSWNYPEAMEADILAGRTYVNIHSTAFPLGEIRGQIVQTPTINMVLVSGTPQSGTWQAKVVSPGTGIFTLPLNATDNVMLSNAGNNTTVTAIDTKPPVINAANAVPKAISADGVDNTTLTVDTKDLGNVSGVASVTVNLTQLGVTGITQMTNTPLGSTTWMLAGVNTTNAALQGTLVNLPLSVTDGVGNSNTTVIPLGIKKLVNITAGVPTPFNVTIGTTVINGNITTTAASGFITVVPVGVPPLVIGLLDTGVVLDFANVNLTPLPDNMKLEMQYNTSGTAVAAGAEAKLRLWHFNPVANAWEMTVNSTVNQAVGVKTVSGNTTTLGMFAPLAASNLIFTTPPAVTAGANSGTITWATNVPSDSVVKFSTNASLFTTNTSLLSIATGAFATGTPATHTVTLTGLTAGVPVFFVVNSTDQTGPPFNTNESTPLLNFTPLAAGAAGGGPAGGGGISPGGGGGGGGGASGENFSNVLLREKYDEVIFKNAVTSYKFKNASNPITHLNVTGNINAGLITAMVEVLRGTSTLVSEAPPGVVNKNVNVWLGTSGFAVPKNIKEVIIRFRVENAWMQSNNVDARDIKMLRWDSTSKRWDPLKTEVKEKVGTVTYFEAETNRLSPLAISAVTTPPGGPIAGGPGETPPAPGGTTGKPTAPKPKGTPGFEIAAAIAAISALYVLGRKIRR